MVKTRSQTGNIAIKKEEEDSKSTLSVDSIDMTTRNKITKRKSSKHKKITLPAQQVKVEEDNDTKSLLKLTPNSSKIPKRQYISQEQINQLIHYIVNDNMSVYKASRKVNISQSTGFRYYNVYRNDLEKRIPLPGNQFMYPKKYCTQEQIENLIRYIDTDKMTVEEASAKANMTYRSGVHYYNRYVKDPNHNIFIRHPYQAYTQDQIGEFISYIVNDKMTIAAASKKAKLNASTGRKYYLKYFKENPVIHRPSHIVTPKRSTQEQLNEAMGYIINDKMSITAASRKANIDHKTTGKRYRQYLKHHNMKVPVKRVVKRYTQDQINEFLRYIMDGKMSTRAASEKANIRFSTGYGWYRRFLKDQKHDGST